MPQEQPNIKDTGFSFDGVDIADLGLEYAPDLNNTYVYAPGSFDVNDETFAAHDGGYFYGTTMKPKDFTLRCIFEQQYLNSGRITRIANVFKRGKTGRLVFHNRPWCWYVATVVKEPQIQPTNYLNGIITFTLRAYYPFARTYQTAIGQDDPNEDDLIRNSAMLKGESWDTSKDFGEMSGQGAAGQKTICVFNPGTETAATAITISGNVGAGIKIYNKATGQTCEIVAYNSEDGADTLTIDSLSGKVLRKKDGTTEYGFLYHDNGFIDLASNYPIMRNIHIVAQNGSSTFTTTDDDITFTEDLIGQSVGFYINDTSAFLGKGMLGSIILNNQTGDKIFYIAQIVGIGPDGKSITTNKRIDLGDDEMIYAGVPVDANIVTFNELVVTPTERMNLTKFAISYLPTFS